ncbi:hypothetical protein CMI46_03305 [Candidatus Pacearchaeota archaeon]|nr:hypothetical protein [Candidatus Pacearchaeota archaeon]|tara:strand:+ start:191 stop:892 length:702 start_codon:yes stop_codon:yes gene_type:complete
MEYNEGDIILCKVTNIVRTTVFVETLDGVKGSIVMSEIAPGRIRNLREYVVPKKIIACKILHIKDDYLFLSLRRVKQNERKDLMDQYKKETTFKTVLKKLCGGECANDIISKIKKDQSLTEFFEDARENPKILTKYFNKEQTEKVEKIISEKEEKEKEIKKEFTLSCKQPNGICIIKDLLGKHKGINYLGNSKYVIKTKSKDLKKASHNLQEILESIEKQAKKEKCLFELKGK